MMSTEFTIHLVVSSYTIQAQKQRPRYFFFLCFLFCRAVAAPRLDARTIPLNCPVIFLCFLCNKENKNTSTNQQTSGFFLPWIPLEKKALDDLWDQATRFSKFCWDVIWAKKQTNKNKHGKGWKFSISNEKFIKQNINKNSLHKQININNRLKKHPFTFYWAHYAWEERKRTDQVSPSSSHHHQHSVRGKKILLSRNRFDTTQHVHENEKQQQKSKKKKKKKTPKKKKPKTRSIKHTNMAPLTPGARVSKVPKAFRARKAIRKTPACLFCKAGLFICRKRNKNKNNCKVSCLNTPSFWRYIENYVTEMRPKKFRDFRPTAPRPRNLFPVTITEKSTLRKKQ